MKVIHLPTSVGGNPQGISYHLRKLGVDSKSIIIVSNQFDYNSDIIITKKNDNYILREFKKILALRYIFFCDVAFFNYGRGLYSLYPNHGRSILAKIYNAYEFLMARLEISLLKLLSKKIFVQFQGSDVRQVKFCLETYEINYFSRFKKSQIEFNTDKLKDKNIQILNRVAEKLYALNPDLLSVMPPKSEFLPYSHISLEDWSPNFNQLEDRPLRIGHAPTNRLVKGTDLFLKAVRKLRKDGFNFEVILIEGLSNPNAKKLYEKVDILVDQFFVGWYGGLAVEAMALGKPVLCFIREDDLKHIPNEMRRDIPVINTSPRNIYKNLKYVLEMPRVELVQLAHNSRAYVEKWHNPINIAKRLKSDMSESL